MWDSFKSLQDVMGPVIRVVGKKQDQEMDSVGPN